MRKSSAPADNVSYMFSKCVSPACTANVSQLRSKNFCRFDFVTEQTLYLPPCLLGHRCAYSTQRKSQIALHDQVVGADCRVELEVELLLQFLVVDF